MDLPTALPPSASALGTGSRIAGFAAALCGVHCALTPLLVLLLPALALSEGVERLFLVGTASLGAVIILAGPARRRPAILIAFALGASVWATSLMGLFEPIPENVTSASGSLVLAGALIAGGRACRSGDCEVCSGQPDARH